MTRKQQLLEIAERCKAGDEFLGRELNVIKPYVVESPTNVWRSLDDAKALHDEVIPSHYYLTIGIECTEQPLCFAEIENINKGRQYFMAHAPTLALAWLACICLVLAEKEESE